MGVHDLWSILGPVRESVPLYSLTGMTLAVDLSLWVCEAQHVQAMMGKVTKPHLRNLFFRVSSLTLMGVKLVFVMEGEAPKLKAETMSKRKDMRFGGFDKSAPKKQTTKTTNRGRFNAVLRECAEMLDCLGVPWVTAAGEAEAMCAFLDAQGLVDGCITNDGDTFLYGARTVYRNFNMNTKDPQVDCYRTSRVETELQLARETLVGLAILLGCDYIPKGIPGVGKEQALKLIQTLKGQTLLQRFSQWREEGVVAPEWILKKVPHCHLCRHPGSAKAHERSGCVLCDSKHFCEPQDYDYQCPCHWHRCEQTRQASSTDASIRKKTLASDKFPFTEIINEFLVDKDKPVHNFKWRKPNMLLMQNFAYNKMEWPKHYTSEKVLVLMTYTELMNRKHGRATSSLIKPLRIWKPRVRNAIASFEIIWSKPDHYVFSEDHPEDSQDEVRTVEEEALFRLAYPHVVERYLREKAENKTKKKKPKGKKDKPSDHCDVSDLLAKMSLHSSTADNNTQQPSAAAEALTITTITPSNNSVLVLEGPESESPKKHLDPGKHHPRLEVRLGAQIQEVMSPLSFTSSGKIPEAVASSPSVSMVMDALHLSDIDWESQSFTSSPPPQAAGACTATDPKSLQTTNDSVEERITKLGPSTDLRAAEAVPGPCYAECSLRDRVLMRNTCKSVNMADNDDVTTIHVNSQSAAPLDLIDNNNSGPKPMALIAIKSSNDSKPSEQPLVCGKKDTLVDKDQSIALPHKPQPAHRSSKPISLNSTQTGPFTSTQTSPVTATQTQGAKQHGAGEPKPPQKYRFVKKAISSSSALPQRSHSEPSNTQPGQGDRNMKSHQETKKSVCASVCSSSEDSDTENQCRGGGQSRAKVKPKSRPRCQYLTDYSLKPTSKPSTSTKAAWDTVTAQPLRPRAVSASMGEQPIIGSSVSTIGKCQDVPPIRVDDDIVFIPSPVSPVTMSDGDDSVICSKSPLPLAERVKLKFLK
ncbi:flap endonuclease GEN homolog 1 [Salmo salar]|uniref:Flap endonuclease GEN homolog 1 n=1 Tax=Salmo salar TaxID=8030 RepID=A0A1S3S9W9_SALSA|nr:flap endonuclease GEN homolog 1 [Salmo salar]|eukprot:XP_014061125.1 PREDICTED: flap endonuclease GEN homolog 1 [Salmo salar]